MPQMEVKLLTVLATVMVTFTTVTGVGHDDVFVDGGDAGYVDDGGNASVDKEAPLAYAVFFAHGTRRGTPRRCTRCNAHRCALPKKT